MRAIVLFFIFLFQITIAQNTALSVLEENLQAEKNVTKKLEIINDIVAIYFNTDMRQALVYAKQGVALAEKSDDKNWQPKFYEMQGRTYANLLVLDSASIFFKKAERGYIAVNDKKGQAKTYFKMAWVHRKNGQLDQALQKDLEGLKLMETINDKTGICDAMTRISDNLTRQNRLKEALNYAKKAIIIADENKLTSELFFVNFNAGDVAMSMSKYQESFNYYDKALSIAKKQNLGAPTLSDILNSRGNAHKRLDKYKEALKDYEKAMNFAKKSNYQNAINTVTANLGEINLLLENYNEALNYQLETVRLQESNSDTANLVENYHHVSTIYAKLGNYKSALAFKQKAYNLRDSIASMESDAKMSEMLTKYETEKKEETIASQESIILQQGLIQNLVIGLAVLLFGLLILGYISFQSRAKKNRLLASKNAENELLLKEIHHRVKNNLEVVSGLLALQSSQIDDQSTKDAMQESQNRVNSIGIVHQKLYQGTNLGAVEMKDYVLNLSESILDSFGATGKVDLELAMEQLDLDIDTAVPLGLIINELITNAVKYAFPNKEHGKLTIKLERQKDNVLHLVVSDNGVGKSGITYGTGFGGQLISLLTNQLNGTMTEENENGTTVIFDFKLKKAA
jgi:two-component sensor histidine kinase/tetratricopeptide (TPR) repeat protein